jgi:hypothetical protein
VFGTVVHFILVWIFCLFSRHQVEDEHQSIADSIEKTLLTKTSMPVVSIRYISSMYGNVLSSPSSYQVVNRSMRSFQPMWVFM